MARSGLRMMPTFPSSPLRFRTAGLPRYGSKAGLSDRTFPDRTSVKLAPSMPVACPGLSPSFVLSVAVWVLRSEPEAAARWNTATLQGPSLRSGLCCPGPSPLSRPHPSHSQAHHNFIALLLICNAFAVRERLGDPRVVPGFRCTFLPDMPSSTTPGSSDIHEFQSRDVDIGLHDGNSGSALPISRNPFHARRSISRLQRFANLLRPVRLLGALYGSDRSPSQRRLLLPGFQRFGRPPRRWISLQHRLDSYAGGTFTRWNGS